MAYINKEKLYELIRLTAHRSSLGETTTPEISANEILSIIADMPDEDVVKVVKCKNCIYFTGEDKNGQGICNCGEIKTNFSAEIYPYANDYCSYGEKKNMCECGSYISKNVNYCSECGREVNRKER